MPALIAQKTSLTTAHFSLFVMYSPTRGDKTWMNFAEESSKWKSPAK